MKMRTTPALVAGFLILLCSAHAQFTGPYSITPPTAGNHVLSSPSTSFGQWTATQNYLGSVDTSLSGSNSITFGAVSVTQNYAHPTVSLTAVATQAITVSFNFSASQVYASGLAGEFTRFSWTTNGGSTWNNVVNITTPTSNGTISPTFVNFSVASGQTFGFLVESNTPGGLGGGMMATVSNFTVAATAVPEPSTYAALLGLGALGVVASRRRFMRRVA